MTSSQYKKILSNPGPWLVSIDSNLSPDPLYQHINLSSFSLSKYNVLLASHIDHPFQFQDGLSGVLLALELEKFLKSKLKNIAVLTFSGIEIVGTSFFCERYSHIIDNLSEVIYLTSTGNSAPLSLQHSFPSTISPLIESLIPFICDFLQVKLDEFDYRRMWGNDEIIFQSPGFNVPSSTLAHFPLRVSFHFRFILLFRHGLSLEIF